MLKRIALVLIAAALSWPAVAGAEWPVWGNDRIPDCTFAAAANWELAALGHRAAQAQVEREYWRAGGALDGISQASFARWWRRHGIGGVRATVRRAGTIGRRLKRLLAHAHFLLATIQLPGGEEHVVLVAGATPYGVRYVTWGLEVTESWSEWAALSPTIEVVAPR